MADTAVPVVASTSAVNSSPNASRGNRSRRRPRRNPNESAGSATTSADEGNLSAGNGRSRRGGFAPRGGRGRGGARVMNGVHTSTGRQFGGGLTQTNTDADEMSVLQPQAQAFIPGQLGPVPKARNPQPRPRERRASKSQAPDIATRTHEDVDNGHYECAVCTNEIYRNSKVWSCHTCWTVFHISCVKKWSQSEGAKVRREQNTGDATVPTSQQWRCPGCNLPQDRQPTSFTCWCEKEADPRSIPGLPPFSCGQSCHREHTIPKKCPHPCSSICHAGPCPPCPQKGPVQSCFCGRETSQKRCVDTDYENGFSCGQVCGEMMPCGEHFCEKPCHEGLCGACEVSVDAQCYCGQVEKQIECCERGDIKSSKRRDSAQETEWLGSFQCGNLCSRAFDCGKHSCDKPCHPQDLEAPHCPRSPDVVTHCPCGKTPLDELTDRPRTSCEDKVPACSKPCLKTLKCGHACQQICHSGECRPCMAKMEISCRCGRTSLPTLCHQGNIEPPECMRICKATLNCGRHECGEHCCTGERRAIERNATKRKLRPLGAAPRLVDEGFEAEHICTRTCGRPLKCGNHICQELCHRGPCNSCREAIFEEISCHCGRTVLQPPLPCGTRPPPCRYQCERPKTCGHPQVPHSCHQDEEACPKCPFLVTKACLCGKHQLKNQPCWLVDVRCGEICGKMLKCGSHFCRQPCHRPGECEDAGAKCTQPCGKEKSCGHPDEAKCHSPFPCKEDKPCQYKIYITCDCQRIKQEAKCGATKTNEGNKTKSLKCDDECARLERNRKLALALNIDPETHKDDHIPYSAETLNTYLNNIQWCTEQEKTLRLFAADPEQKRFRWKPMQKAQRAFIHNLADDFGFDSESMDPEPHRHVAIWKTPRFVMAPMKTLAECARIRRVQNIAAASAAVAKATEAQQAQQEALKQKQKASNLVGEPYNGFVITQPRFGLTIEEISTVVHPTVHVADPTLSFDISFLPNEEVVLKPKPTWTRLVDRNLETFLSDLKPALSTACKKSHLGNLQLCRLDDSLNITRLESESLSSGWSQVAAKAAAPRRTLVAAQPKSASNSFTVLMSAGQQALRKKNEEEKRARDEEKKREKELRKKLEAEVEEDWADAAEEQEVALDGAAEAESSGPQAAEAESLAGSFTIKAEEMGSVAESPSSLSPAKVEETAE